MELFVALASIVFYFSCLVITANTFYRKGQSGILGAALGIFLPVISLIVALVMPYDQPALEDRKRRKAFEDERNQARFVQWQQEYAARHPAQPLPASTPYEESPASARAQTICGALLIACPLISAFQPGETVTAILGLVTFLALDGMIVALFLPFFTRARSDA